MEEPVRHPPDEVYRSIRDTDPDLLDAEEIAALVGRIAELTAWCDARLVSAIRRQRELAAEGRASDPRSTLCNDGRTSGKGAAAAAAREAVCTSMPGFEDALARGGVSTGHIDAIAAATRGLDDHERAEFAGEAESLLGDATKQGVDTFARNCRDLATGIRARHDARSDLDELERQQARSKVTRWVDAATGMHKTLIEADPVTDRLIWTAVQHARSALRRRHRSGQGPKPTWDRLTVDAVVEAVTSTDSGGMPRRPSLVVHVGLDELVDGVRGRGICETDSGVAVPVATVRRLACDADIIPVVLDGRGVVLDQGRAKRLATAEQRLALEAMQATCSHPDCTVSIDDCRIHHVDPWSRGGRTDLADLAPVCEPHHHLVHEGGWTLTMTADRVATWIRPDGTIHWSGSVADRAVAA
jgi:hypothetical protein